MWGHHTRESVLFIKEKDHLMRSGPIYINSLTAITPDKKKSLSQVLLSSVKIITTINISKILPPLGEFISNLVTISKTKFINLLDKYHHLYIKQRIRSGILKIKIRMLRIWRTPVKVHNLKLNILSINRLVQQTFNRIISGMERKTQFSSLSLQKVWKILMFVI